MGKRLVVATSLFLWLVATGAASAQNLDTLLMANAELERIRGSLPDFVDPKLSRILGSGETLWYDESAMKRSYQDSIGASSNDKWPDLVAASESIIGGLHDRTKKRWQFPFATTAGTDESSNIHISNFVWFPQTNGRISGISIQRITANAGRPAWRWKYGIGTVFGEIVFLTHGSDWLPVEVRTRTRYEGGWAANIFRPFPRATDLAKRIKELRPGWATTPSLKRMIDFLGDESTLVPAKLEAKGNIASTFQQEGYLDVLPPFGDDELVKELLTTTPFRSSFGQTWKAKGDRRTFAASTKSTPSIVPIDYKAGLLEVSDDSCKRCHQETSRLVSEFYPDLYLYGEIWGMDGIFSFHPYDERRYPELRLNMVDNRSLNPKLEQAGVFRKAFR